MGGRNERASGGGERGARLWREPFHGGRLCLTCTEVRGGPGTKVDGAGRKRAGAPAEEIVWSFTPRGLVVKQRAWTGFLQDKGATKGG